VGHPDQQIPKILTAVVGNAAPDILWYSPNLTGQLVELEALEPLDDWWADLPLREQIDPALLETMTFEDQLWSIPFGANNTAVYYRPSLFASRRASPHHPPPGQRCGKPPKPSPKTPMAMAAPIATVSSSL
jgi:multiple sugar transport system substrate-binding protein